MSLLRQLQLLTERTYGRWTGVNFEEFLIGRRRFRDLSLLAAPYCRELSDAGRVFLRLRRGRLLLAIYYDDAMIDVLEKNDPRAGLSERNIEEFIVFVEELNHAIHSSIRFLEGERAIAGEEFIRRIELLARIDTYLTCAFFLAAFNRSRRLEGFDRLWLRHHLFERERFDYPEPLLRERYAEVNSLGGKFVRFLEGLRPEDQVAEMRRLRLCDYSRQRWYIFLLPG